MHLQNTDALIRVHIGSSRSGDLTWASARLPQHGQEQLEVFVRCFDHRGVLLIRNQLRAIAGCGTLETPQRVVGEIPPSTTQFSARLMVATTATTHVHRASASHGTAYVAAPSIDRGCCRSLAGSRDTTGTGVRKAPKGVQFDASLFGGTKKKAFRSTKLLLRKALQSRDDAHRFEQMETLATTCVRAYPADRPPQLRFLARLVNDPTDDQAN